MKLKNCFGLVVLMIVVSILVFWFAQNQFTLIFSVAAVGYPHNLMYVILNFILIGIFVLFIGFRKKWPAYLQASTLLSLWRYTLKCMDFH